MLALFVSMSYVRASVHAARVRMCVRTCVRRGGAIGLKCARLLRERESDLRGAVSSG